MKPSFAFACASMLIVASVAVIGNGWLARRAVTELRRQVNEDQAHVRELMDLADMFDSDGRMRQEASEDRKLRLEKVCTISGQKLTGQAQFSPAENSFAVITRTGAVQLFSVACRRLREVASPGDKVTAIAYASDGKRLLTGTGLGKVLLWDLDTGTSREVFARPDRAVVRVAWLSNPERGVAEYNDRSNLLTSGGFVFRAADGELLARFSASGRADYQGLAASPDGKWIGALDVPGHEGPGYPAGLLLDSEQGQVKATLHDDRYPGGPLSIGIAPDNNTVAVGYGPYHLSLWDGAQQKELRLIEAHSNWVVTLGFSPDSKRLISGAGDSTARIWDVQTGKEIGRIRFAFETYVNAVGFSPDGRLVLAAADNDVIVVAKTPK